MKTNLLLITVCGFVLVGCCQRKNQREVLTQLEAIRSELASKRAETVRWAFANRLEIDYAVSQWSRVRMEDIKKAEALSPEVEEKIRQYDALESELLRKRMDLMRARLPGRPGTPETAPSDGDFQTLSNRVAEARAPIAEIIDRRNRHAAQIREQYSAGKLISEYARDLFDLVVDSSDVRPPMRSVVLYRTNGEVLDITDGVIKLFKEKTKQ